MSNIKSSFRAFMRFRPLLGELVKRDIKVRYRHSFLGMLWTVLNPLLNMIVMTIVFSRMFRMDIKNFPLYVMIGNVVYAFNSDATSQSMNSILFNASLIKKVYIPKYLFPLSNVLSCLVNFGFSFVAMLLVMVFTRAEFHLTIFTAWVPLLYLLMFSFGLGLILCSINVFFRDMQHLYGVILALWTYLSGIFYTPDIVSGKLRMLIVYNPMYQYISFFRTIIMDGYFPSMNTNIVCAGWGIGMMLLGLLVFYKTQNKFILHI